MVLNWPVCRGFNRYLNLCLVKKLQSYGHVTDSGELRISYREKFMQAAAQFRGRRVKITVEPLYKKRSTMKIHDNGTVTRAQNGYYHGVVVNEYRNGAWEMQQRTLNSDEAHAELKTNCNFEDQFNESTGEVMRKIKSTADLTTVEFEEYLIRCRAFILEWFGIDCPGPEDVGYK
jgi:hypothetical protein